MDLGECKCRRFVCGEEALKISPTQPYCFRRPIQRGHFNISQDYPVQQVCEDLHTIWDWKLVEKLHIPQSERTMYSAILVVPETFDNHGFAIKNAPYFCVMERWSGKISIVS